MRYLILLTVFFCALAGLREADGGDVLVKAVNLEKLNTAADEEDPCPDGNSLLFARKGAK